MKTDPALETVRKARIEISREFGNDPVRLYQHYIELQSRYKGRLILGVEGESAEDKRVSNSNTPHAVVPDQQ